MCNNKDKALRYSVGGDSPGMKYCVKMKGPRQTLKFAKIIMCTYCVFIDFLHAILRSFKQCSSYFRLMMMWIKCQEGREKSRLRSALKSRLLGP